MPPQTNRSAWGTARCSRTGDSGGPIDVVGPGARVRIGASSQLRKQAEVEMVVGVDQTGAAAAGRRAPVPRRRARETRYPARAAGEYGRPGSPHPSRPRGWRRAPRGRRSRTMSRACPRQTCSSRSYRRQAFRETARPRVPSQAQPYHEAASGLAMSGPATAVQARPPPADRSIATL